MKKINEIEIPLTIKLTIEVNIKSFNDVKENITNTNRDVSLNETGNFLTTVGEEIIIS